MRRHLEMVGLAALAMVITAIAGASAASATRLCSASTSPCPAPNIYGVTKFDSHLRSNTNAVLAASGGLINPTITCSAATLQLTNTNQGGGVGVNVAVQITGLTLSTCASTNPMGCESHGTVGSVDDATGTIAWTSGVNGTLQFTPPTISFSCPIFGSSVTCVFGGSGTVDAAVTGGSSAIIHIYNQSIASTGGFGCPSAAVLYAPYQTTSPLFITNS